MTTDNAELAQRAASLRDELHKHLYHYHVLSAPLISDAEFDVLYNELRAIEAEHPELITPDSPTQRAGSDLSPEFAKVAHPAPILSLSNGYTTEDLQAWEERNLRLLPAGTVLDYTLEPKLDGLTVVLRYENGVLTQAATRGNGTLGDDVTTNIRTIPSVPLRIPQNPDKGRAPERLVVRGEILFLKRAFEALNAKQIEQELPPFINARNAASGSLKQKDSRITRSRSLTAYIYGIVDSVGITLDKQWDLLEFLRDMGFLVAPGSTYYPTLNDIIQQIPTWESRRDALDFEIDGVVIKVNNLRATNELGIVGKDPRGAIAYKFPAREATTKLTGVQVNVGRTGRVVPNAMLEPVFISGVTVSNATLHNFDYIAIKDIRIGDRVMLKRAGEVNLDVLEAQLALPLLPILLTKSLHDRPVIALQRLERFVRNPAFHQRRSRANQRIAALNAMFQKGERLAGFERLHPERNLAQFDRHRIDVYAINAMPDHITKRRANRFRRRLTISGARGCRMLREPMRGCNQKVTRTAGRVYDFQS